MTKAVGGTLISNTYKKLGITVQLENLESLVIIF